MYIDDFNLFLREVHTEKGSHNYLDYEGTSKAEKEHSYFNSKNIPTVSLKNDQKDKFTYSFAPI